jgi:hypothetical protein
VKRLCMASQPEAHMRGDWRLVIAMGDGTTRLGSFEWSLRMPRRSRIDPLASALTAPKSAAYFGDDDCRGQSVHVDIGLMPASLAGRDNSIDAVLAHIRQRHRRPWLFTRDHY